MDLRLSPYKSLSYAFQFPGAQITFRQWNAFSRIDRVQSRGIRSLPGLSYRYLKLPPLQDGLFIDGDDLSPIVTDLSNLNFTQFFPSYLAFTLRPDSKTLILEPRGGLDILIALAGYAQQVTAIEVNPLIVEAAAPIYEAPRVQTILTSDRAYLSQSKGQYDVIMLSLASSYHPVHSGAYSLVEDYRYTLEALLEMMKHLAPGGLLVVSRWIQTPPSESLRVFTLATTALRQLGADPAQQIIIMRGFNTATLFIKNGAYTGSEIGITQEFAEKRAFDLDYFPGIKPEDTNRFNILPNPMDYMVYQKFLQSDPPDRFYSSYLFDVRPPTDDRPFFSHSFKWEQTSQVIAEMGKTWQPFGGAGYFVVIVLLALACAAAILLILLPLAFSRAKDAGSISLYTIPPRIRISALLYFSSIGFAYLFVEIPLIQRFILYLGSPAYAMTTVLFTLLLFSSWGSQLSRRFSARKALILLGIILILYPQFLSKLFEQTLELASGLKLIISILLLAPVGFLMGIPFPSGIINIIKGYKLVVLIPWLWAVNGAASVIASILAALLALNWGFSMVLYLGAAGYIFAWLTGRASVFEPLVPHPVQ